MDYIKTESDSNMEIPVDPNIGDVVSGSIIVGNIIVTSPMNSSCCAEFSDLHISGKITCSSLEERIRVLEERILALEYQPGGMYYQQAKEHYDNLSFKAGETQNND